MHKPISDLSLDRHASNCSEFPYEAREAGRQKELDNIYDFDCVEDYSPSPQEIKKACSMIWVEEWRGDEVRARLCVRQFNLGKRTDVFSGIP